MYFVWVFVGLSVCVWGPKSKKKIVLKLQSRGGLRQVRKVVIPCSWRLWIRTKAKLNKELKKGEGCK